MPQVLSEAAGEFVRIYVNQPPYRRDITSAYQAAFPRTTRIAQAHKAGVSILNNPLAQQLILTLTAWTAQGVEHDFSRDEQALNLAWLQVQNSKVGIERRQALQTYSALRKALSVEKAPKEGESGQSGALGSVLASIRGGIGEELGNSE